MRVYRLKAFKSSLSIVLSGILTCSLQAQEPTLNMGDPAPPLYAKTWLKGDPVKKFEKGKIYVLEFWATWCAPCRAAMPKLSAFAEKYKDITVISFNVKELNNPPVKKIQAFVDSMGDKMKYRVAMHDKGMMDEKWLKSSGQSAIPATFIVGKDGIIVWTGHPMLLDSMIQKVMNDDIDIAEDLGRRKERRYLDSMSSWLSPEFAAYKDNPLDSLDIGKPDSALKLVQRIVQQEPRLVYTPFIVYNTFSSLLKLHIDSAYVYGRSVLRQSFYEHDSYHSIKAAIKDYENKLKLPPKIFALGAEVYELEIADIVYPENVSMHKYYNNMATWYWKAGNIGKAVSAQQKAIEAFKNQNQPKKDNIADLEYSLEKYRAELKPLQ